MFGVSFTELLLIGAVTLLVVGPDRLPKMLGTLGRWSAKLRRLSNEVRQQSGIDDMLRKEGITGGLNELRSLRNVARGDFSAFTKSKNSGPAGTTPAGAATPSAAASAAGPDPYQDVAYDRSREYPVEGCDAYGALPDDLWHDPAEVDSPPISELNDDVLAPSPAPGASDPMADPSAPPATETSPAAPALAQSKPAEPATSSPIAKDSGS